MKKYVRFLGIDDSHFERKKQKCAKLIGAIVRKNDLLEGILIKEIAIDGLDASEKIIEMVKESKYKDQIKTIFLNGITFAGFNIVDVEFLFKNLKMPIIIFIRKYPNFNKIFDALKKHFKDYEKRIEIIKKAGNVYKILNAYYQFFGIDLENAKKLIKESIKVGNVPECIRIAHLIASALEIGESKGRA